VNQKNADAVDTRRETPDVSPPDTHKSMTEVDNCDDEVNNITMICHRSTDMITKATNS